MNEQIGTNMVTWFVILPILVIAAAVIVWLVIKTHVTPWKRTGLAVAGLFAFIGFAFVLLGVYYNTSETFAGSFKFYAYSALAPQQEPFDIAEGGYGSVLATFEAYKENGALKVLRVPKSSAKYGAYIFSPGKWTVVDISDDVITLQEDANSQPNITQTSFWWALTKNLYRSTVNAQ